MTPEDRARLRALAETEKIAKTEYEQADQESEAAHVAMLAKTGTRNEREDKRRAANAAIIKLTAATRALMAAFNHKIVLALLNELDRQDAALLSAEADGRRKGREEMREEAALVVDQCNHEGPYNAIGAASRIRALPLEAPQDKRDPG